MTRSRAGVARALLVAASWQWRAALIRLQGGLAMSMFADDGYQWRETYFVVFDRAKRPSLDNVRQAVSRLDSRFQLTNLTANEDGAFEAMTVIAPDDFSAVEVSYVDGEDVVEERARLAKELRDVLDRRTLQQITSSDARFDIMHFERRSEDAEADDSFDPSALLMILSALAELTAGIGIDPQSGVLT